jgi:hypothetical protein
MNPFNLLAPFTGTSLSPERRELVRRDRRLRNVWQRLSNTFAQHAMKSGLQGSWEKVGVASKPHFP